MYDDFCVDFTYMESTSSALKQIIKPTCLLQSKWNVAYKQMRFL